MDVLSAMDRYLHHLAHYYANWRVPAEDLEQEGRIAAWQAERDYQPGRGMSPLSFKVLAARRAMLNSLVSPPSNRVDRAPLFYDGMLDNSADGMLAGRDFAPMLIDVLSPEPTVEKPSDNLTPSELGVLKLLCQGLTAQEAAQQWGCATRSVQSSVLDIYKKWKVRNIVAAYNEAMRRGVIEPPRRREE